MKADRLSVGSLIKEETESFTNHGFELQKGDMLYMFSDGYVDQTGGKDNKKFFATPFRELLQSVCKQEETKQKEILDETIMNWKGKKSQIDDILVIGIRII